MIILNALILLWVISTPTAFHFRQTSGRNDVSILAEPVKLSPAGRPASSLAILPIFRAPLDVPSNSMVFKTIHFPIASITIIGLFVSGVCLGQTSMFFFLCWCIACFFLHIFLKFELKIPLSQTSHV